MEQHASYTARTHMFLKKYVVLVLVYMCVFFFGTSSLVYGATSDFIVRQLVGLDTTPPTAPSWITATPIALSQIDLAWGTSTDDYILSGYHVYRDDVFVATTTNTTYSDTGLTASTTYTYYVTAFDYFNNVSASSSPVATTTYATPTPPVTPTTTPSDGPTYGSKARLPELVSLEVIPSQYGAVIRFETESPVRSILKWGTSVSYEIGSSAERSFSRFHEIAITDLAPGARYRFSLEGETHMGRFGVLTESTFVTLPGDDVTPPGLVTGLTAVREGNDIILTWQNPRDSDFDHVRVVRNTHFYPDDEVDGWVVYDGDAVHARDTGIVAPGAHIYYSVFTYDMEGNMSAPSVISLLVPRSGEGGVLPPVITDDPKENEITLSITDVVLYQDGKEIPYTGGRFTIDGSRHLTIAMRYDALPEHLKTILVTIAPKTDDSKVLQFLLRVNREKTAYTARLAPLGIPGTFSLRVSVFDFKTTQIGYTAGEFVSVIGAYEEGEATPQARGRDSLFFTILRFILSNIAIVFIVLLLILAFFMRKIFRESESHSD
jgi:hypothetical protein